MSDHFLNAVREHLKTHNLISLFRKFRQIVHFGPWRVVPKFIIRQLRPAKFQPDDQTAFLRVDDVGAFISEIRQNSVAIAGVLPKETVKRLRDITDRLPVDDYQLMHTVNDDVYALSEDPGLLNILRTYFGCEPELLESTIVVSNSFQHKQLSEQNYFHFDYAGWESLNVFVYLTDVKENSSHHVVVRGSHRGIGIGDILHDDYNDAEITRRFGPAIQPILGPAGTVFMENTEAFHKQHPGNERRVMLNLLYATHRNWLSLGRTSRKHAAKRSHTLSQIQRLSQNAE